MRSYKYFFCLLFPFFAYSVSAQKAATEKPFSQSEIFAQYFPNANLESIDLPKIDLQKIRAEDLRNGGMSPRVAAPINANFGLQNGGQWLQLPNGDRIWRLKIRSEGAISLSFLLDQFSIPAGARLFFFNDDETRDVFTSKNNTPNQKFAVHFLKGSSATIEYYEPKNATGRGLLHIFKIYHTYVAEPSTTSREIQASGFGASSACNRNVNCSTGNNWQKEKKGVLRITMSLVEGIGYCTGTLLNNTKNDGKPYLLSAFHCQDGYTPLYDFWAFDFHYESPNCSNPSTEPNYAQILGCKLKAGRQSNDFLLLELNATPPPSFNAYYNGWNRDSVALPTRSTLIHHPRGDIKKISVDKDPSTVYQNVLNWNNNVTTPAGNMLRVVPDTGYYEVGSSGCALFNQNKLVVGQLHGGNLAPTGCGITNMYFDRLCKSWEGGGTPSTRLKDWLDPQNTGALTLGALDPPDTLPTYTLEGIILNEKYLGVSGVQLKIDGDTVHRTVMTDTGGVYRFYNLPSRFVYELTTLKDTNLVNGVTTFDMVLVRKQILGVDTFSTPYKHIAADVNASGTVTTFDLVAMRKAILNIDTHYEGNTSWRMIPTIFSFPDPSNPFSTPLPSSITVTNPVGDPLRLDFWGIKIGDINASADPKK